MMRRSLLLFGALAVLLAGFAPGADANHSCYPGRCKYGDAKLTSIGTPSVMFAGGTSLVSVNGRNIGRASKVHASLESNNATTSPMMGANVFVGADDPFSVYFKVTPHRAERTRLRGCVTARPKDQDRSNNCGSTKVKVRRGS